MDSFKRHQHEEELKELRKVGVIVNIPQQYGIELPMISLAEVAEFAAGLAEASWVDENGKTRNRKLELVSLSSDKLKPWH